MRDKTISKVKLTPIFDILLGDKLKKLFEDRPSRVACEDVFEQILKFTLSEMCMWIKSIIDSLIGL